MITLNLGVIAPCRTNSWFNSAIDNTAFLIKISDDSLSFEPVTAIGYVNLLTVNFQNLGITLHISPQLRPSVPSQFCRKPYRHHKDSRPCSYAHTPPHHRVGC